MNQKSDNDTARIVAKGKPTKSRDLSSEEKIEIIRKANAKLAKQTGS